MNTVQYFESDGELWFSYRKEVELLSEGHESVRRAYKLQARVPQRVILQGEEVVRAYVEKKVVREVKRQEAYERKRARFAENPNVALAVRHDGHILKGKIVSANNYGFVVELNHPARYRGQFRIRFGCGSPDMFQTAESFTKKAIEYAEERLVRFYEEKKCHEQHGEIIRLAERLNSSIQKNPSS